jgi:hypothetical protein
MRTLLVVAILLVLLAGAAFAAYRTWFALEGVEIPLAGMIALGLGIVVTLALGVGLMFLVFYSSRRGYDDPDRSSPPDSRS